MTCCRQLPQKDPTYVVKHNFEVVTPKGEVVTDNQLNPEVLEGIRSLHLIVCQKPAETKFSGPGGDHLPQSRELVSA
jgi:murein L,D-transpeptidase YcbB/YkuD